MKDKSIEDTLQEINEVIHSYSEEQQPVLKDLIGSIITTLTLNNEELNKVKQNLVKNRELPETFKNYFLELVDSQIEKKELDSMSPAKRKSHKFMELVNTADEQEREILKYKLQEDGKYELTINNGPFGVLDYGRNEDGKLGIGLRISRRSVSDQVVYVSEDELESFFEKSNMEILSIFNKELDRRQHSFEETTLRTLYLIDCLRDKGIPFKKEFYDLTNAHIHLELENGQDLNSTDEYCEIGRAGEDSDIIIINDGEEPITMLENTDSQMHSIFVEANEKFPKIIEQVKDGKYHSRLAKREAQLSALEEEAIRDTAELKDFESKEGQNIGE